MINKWFIVAISSTFISGCGGVSAITSSYEIYNTVSTFQSIKSISSDRRTIGEILDNKISKIKINDVIREVIGGRNSVGFMIYDKKLLLTGSIDNSNIKNKLISSLKSINGVGEIKDNIEIGKEISLSGKGMDAIITGLVKGKISNLDSGADLTVHTDRKIVYVMGRLTENESDLVLKKISNIPGVKKVNYYIINDDKPSELISRKDYAS